MVVVLLLGLGLASVGSAEASSYGRVVIRRTEGGIPHIVANSYLGLGYGFGYAFAQDDICTMAEAYVTVEAQRSRFFGPDGFYLQRGNGTRTNNLDSDTFWQYVKESGIVDRLLAARGRFAIPRDVRDAVRGYVAGYNRYLRRVGGSRGITDPTCRGRSWVRPITVRTAYLRLYQLSLLASADVAIPGIAAAAPPSAGARADSAARQKVDATRLVRALRARPVMRAAGSNAVAVGSAGTRDHRHGLLLGNPHFPWIGPERFYQAQVTIPGRVDVSGATLFGVPAILIGHTRSLAWSHTVSTAFRFTPYQLTLAPGSPTTYMVDGKPVPMKHRQVWVWVRTAQGALRHVSHTIWSSRWGLVFTQLQGQALPWTTTTAFALGDANADNFRVFTHFFAVDRAQSVAQLVGILRRYEGLPWVNTIAADRSGHALYADVGTIPHVTNAEAARCNTPLGKVAFAALGLPILDGSRSSCAWGSDRDAAVPGIFGWSHLPHLERRDYVTNSNDSYWLSNPAHPLVGFARIIGDERTQRSLRTRIGLIMTRQIIRSGGFTRERMQRMVLSDRQYGGELIRDGVVRMCRGRPGGRAPLSSGGTIAVGSACEVLAHWDLHENLHSHGAILFRRIWWHSPDAAGLYSHQFDPRDPIDTPFGYQEHNPANQQALGDAIADLRGAHIPLNAAPGDVQKRAGIPIHGGPGDPNGEFNAIYSDFTPGRGFGPITEGSSYIQVVTWHHRACPDAATILTYSESANPRSPHFSDQTRLFSRKRWLTDHFCRADVLRHTRSVLVLSAR